MGVREEVNDAIGTYFWFTPPEYNQKWIKDFIRTFETKTGLAERFERINDLVFQAGYSASEGITFKEALYWTMKLGSELTLEMMKREDSHD